MRKIVILVMIIGGLNFIFNFPSQASMKLNFEEGVLLIGLKQPQEQLPPDVQEVCNKYGLKEVKKLKLPGVFKLTFPVETDIEKVKKELENLAEVSYVELNYKLKAEGFLKLGKVEPQIIEEQGITPNDPNFSKQWGLKKIQADQAWTLEKGTEDIKIAIIDTGCDLNHEDLKKRIDLDSSKNLLNPTKPPQDDNVEGHGTHVAGIIGAETDNNKGIAGITWHGKIVIIKALNKNGEADIDMLADAIVEAADIEGVKVINMSWGGEYTSSTLHQAVQYAYNKGITLVAAAGNHATSAKYIPASYPEVIGVTATKEDDSPCYEFTNYNPNGKKYYTISAPGRYIYSTLPEDKGKYGYMDGTSMASAHVAGSCALLLSKKPDLTPSEIKQLLEENSDPIKDEEPDKDIGEGRVNIYKALSAISEEPSPKEVKAVAWVGEKGKKEIKVDKGETVQFYGDSSQGPEGKQLQYLWDFKDGSCSQLENPTHVYNKNGVYEPTLTVVVEDSIDTDSVKVIVGVIPTPTPTPSPTPTPTPSPTPTPTPTPEVAYVSGRVTSAATGEPLQGVWVSATASSSRLPVASDTTDSNGEYELEIDFGRSYAKNSLQKALATKTYTISARKARYKPEEKDVSLSPGERKVVNFSLEEVPSESPPPGGGGGCGGSASQ